MALPRTTPTRGLDASVDRDVDDSLGNQFATGLEVGARGLAAGLAGFGEIATGAVGLDEAAGFFKEVGEEQEAAAQEASAELSVADVRDIDSVDSAAEWAIAGLGQLIPSVALSLTGGGLAGVAARGLGATASRAAAQSLSRTAAARNAARETVARGLGAGAASAAPQAGETFREIRERTGREERGTALLTGAAQGALDVVGLGAEIKALKALRGGAGRTARQRLGTAARAPFIEGATEVGQEALGAGAVAFEDEEFDFEKESPELAGTLINAFALGMLGGSVFAAPGAVKSASELIGGGVKDAEIDEFFEKAQIKATRNGAAMRGIPVEELDAQGLPQDDIHFTAAEKALGEVAPHLAGPEGPRVQLSVATRPSPDPKALADLETQLADLAEQQAQPGLLPIQARSLASAERSLRAAIGRLQPQQETVDLAQALAGWAEDGDRTHPSFIAALNQFEQKFPDQADRVFSLMDDAARQPAPAPAAQPLERDERAQFETDLGAALDEALRPAALSTAPSAELGDVSLIPPGLLPEADAGRLPPEPIVNPLTGELQAQDPDVGARAAEAAETALVAGQDETNEARLARERAELAERRSEETRAIQEFGRVLRQAPVVEGEARLGPKDTVKTETLDIGPANRDKLRALANQGRLNLNDPFTRAALGGVKKGTLAGLAEEGRGEARFAGEEEEEFELGQDSDDFAFGEVKTTEEIDPGAYTPLPDLNVTRKGVSVRGGGQSPQKLVAANLLTLPDDQTGFLDVDVIQRTVDKLAREDPDNDYKPSNMFEVERREAIREGVVEPTAQARRLVQRAERLRKSLPENNAMKSFVVMDPQDRATLSQSLPSVPPALLTAEQRATLRPEVVQREDEQRATFERRGSEQDEARERALDNARRFLSSFGRVVVAPKPGTKSRGTGRGFTALELQGFDPVKNRQLQEARRELKRTQDAGAKLFEAVELGEIALGTPEYQRLAPLDRRALGLQRTVERLEKELEGGAKSIVRDPKGRTLDARNKARNDLARKRLSKETVDYTARTALSHSPSPDPQMKGIVSEAGKWVRDPESPLWQDQGFLESFREAVASVERPIDGNIDFNIAGQAKLVNLMSAMAQANRDLPQSLKTEAGKRVAFASAVANLSHLSSDSETDTDAFAIANGYQWDAETKSYELITSENRDPEQVPAAIALEAEELGATWRPETRVFEVTDLEKARASGLAEHAADTRLDKKLERLSKRVAEDVTLFNAMAARGSIDKEKIPPNAMAWRDGSGETKFDHREWSVAELTAEAGTAKAVKAEIARLREQVTNAGIVVALDVRAREVAEAKKGRANLNKRLKEAEKRHESLLKQEFDNVETQTQALIEEAEGAGLVFEGGVFEAAPAAPVPGAITGAVKRRWSQLEGWDESYFELNPDVWNMRQVQFEHLPDGDPAQAKATLPMNYAHNVEGFGQQNAAPFRPDVVAALKAQGKESTAYDAIVAGLRTATSRRPNAMPNLKVGDVVRITAKGRPPIAVRVTKAPYSIRGQIKGGPAQPAAPQIATDTPAEQTLRNMLENGLLTGPVTTGTAFTLLTGGDLSTVNDIDVQGVAPEARRIPERYTVSKQLDGSTKLVDRETKVEIEYVLEQEIKGRRLYVPQATQEAAFGITVPTPAELIKVIQSKSKTGPKDAARIVALQRQQLADIFNARLRRLQPVPKEEIDEGGQRESLQNEDAIDAGKAVTGPLVETFGELHQIMEFRGEERRAPGDRGTFSIEAAIKWLAPDIGSEREAEISAAAKTRGYPKGFAPLYAKITGFPLDQSLRLGKAQQHLRLLRKFANGAFFTGLFAKRTHPDAEAIALAAARYNLRNEVFGQRKSAAIQMRMAPDATQRGALALRAHRMLTGWKSPFGDTPAQQTENAVAYVNRAERSTGGWSEPAPSRDLEALDGFFLPQSAPRRAPTKKQAAARAEQLKEEAAEGQGRRAEAEAGRKASDERRAEIRAQAVARTGKQTGATTLTPLEDAVEAARRDLRTALQSQDADAATTARLAVAEAESQLKQARNLETGANLAGLQAQRNAIKGALADPKSDEVAEHHQDALVRAAEERDKAGELVPPPMEQPVTAATWKRVAAQSRQKGRQKRVTDLVNGGLASAGAAFVDRKSPVRVRWRYVGAAEMARLAGPQTKARMQDGSLWGQVWTNEEGVHSLYVHPDVADGKHGKLLQDVVAHEIGHMIFRTALDQATMVEKRAIYKEFQAWLEANRGKEAEQVFLSKGVRAETVEQMLRHDAKAFGSPEDETYLFDFEEWFADQVVTQGGTVTAGVSRSLFQQVARTLQLVYNYFVPTNSVAKFVGNIGRNDQPVPVGVSRATVAAAETPPPVSPSVGKALEEVTGEPVEASPPVPPSSDRPEPASRPPNDSEAERGRNEAAFKKLFGLEKRQRLDAERIVKSLSRRGRLTAQEKDDLNEFERLDPAGWARLTKKLAPPQADKKQIAKALAAAQARAAAEEVATTRVIPDPGRQSFNDLAKQAMTVAGFLDAAGNRLPGFENTKLEVNQGPADARRTLVTDSVFLPRLEKNGSSRILIRVNPSVLQGVPGTEIGDGAVQAQAFQSVLDLRAEMDGNAPAVLAYNLLERRYRKLFSTMFSAQGATNELRNLAFRIVVDPALGAETRIVGSQWHGEPWADGSWAEVRLAVGPGLGTTDLSIEDVMGEDGALSVADQQRMNAVDSKTHFGDRLLEWLEPQRGRITAYTDRAGEVEQPFIDRFNARQPDPTRAEVEAAAAQEAAEVEVEIPGESARDVVGGYEALYQFVHGVRDTVEVWTLDVERFLGPGTPRLAEIEVLNKRVRELDDTLWQQQGEAVDAMQKESMPEARRLAKVFADGAVEAQRLQDKARDIRKEAQKNARPAGRTLVDDIIAGAAPAPAEAPAQPPALPPAAPPATPAAPEGGDGQGPPEPPPIGVGPAQPLPPSTPPGADPAFRAARPGDPFHNMAVLALKLRPKFARTPKLEEKAREGVRAWSSVTYGLHTLLTADLRLSRRNADRVLKQLGQAMGVRIDPVARRRELADQGVNVDPFLDALLAALTPAPAAAPPRTSRPGTAPGVSPPAGAAAPAGAPPAQPPAQPPVGPPQPQPPPGSGPQPARTLKDILAVMLQPDPRLTLDELSRLFRTRADGGILRKPEYAALARAMIQPVVGRQMRVLLAGRQDALDSIDPDKDVAWMHNRMVWAYQLGVRGRELRLGPNTREAYAKTRRSFERVTGRFLYDSQADQVLKGLTGVNGVKAGIVRRAQGKVGAFNLKVWREDVGKSRATMQAVFKAVEKLASPSGVGSILYGLSDRRLRATGNPWAIRLADILHIAPGSEEQRGSFLGDKMQMLSHFQQVNRNIHRGLNAKQVAEVGRVLRKVTPPQAVGKKVREAAANARKLFTQMHAYLREAGVELGTIADYYPMVFDVGVLENDSEAFVDLLNHPDFHDKVEDLRAQFNAKRTKFGDEPVDSKAEFVDQLWSGIVEDGGFVGGDIEEVAGPGTRLDFRSSFRFQNQRLLDFLWDDSPAAVKHRETVDAFLSQDHSATMSAYIQGAVKRAETTRAFGPNGEELKKIFRNMEATGATEAELKLARHAVAAHLGTLGAGFHAKFAEKLGLPSPRGRVINEQFNDMQSWLLVTLNVAFLPLAVLSSMIDPVGIFVRTGNAGAFWHGLTIGMASMVTASRAAAKEAGKVARRKQSVKKGLEKFRNRKLNRTEEIGEAVGIADREVALDAISAGHTQNQLPKNARAVNDAFFSWTGLTGWTRLTRRMALGSGMHLIKLIKQGKLDKATAERRLLELNLTKEDIDAVWDETLKEVHVMGTDERFEETQKGTAESRARLAADAKMAEALRRFVDESVLHPNPSMRPVWMSNPWLAIPGYLRHYAFSFYDRIVLRTAHEFKQRPFLPKGRDEWGFGATVIAQMSMYSGVMLAADAMRHALQNKDDDDEREDWTVVDWYAWGLYRAGMFGQAGILYEALEDRQHGGVGYESMFGPAVEFLTDDGPDMLAFGSEESDDAWLKTSPGAALHKNWDLWDE